MTTTITSGKKKHQLESLMKIFNDFWIISSGFTRKNTFLNSICRFSSPTTSGNARYQIEDTTEAMKRPQNLERSTVVASSEEETEYEYYYEYIYEDDLPQFQEKLPPMTTVETTVPTKLEATKRTILADSVEPPLTASNGEITKRLILNKLDC